MKILGGTNRQVPRVAAEPLYAIRDFGRLSGTYNLQIVTILFILSVKALAGNKHFLPEAVAGGSLLAGLFVDNDPWARKLSGTSVTRQMQCALALLGHVISDVWPGWIVALALGTLFATNRARFSFFSNVNMAGTVSFLGLVTLRAFVAVRYLSLAAHKPWTDVVKAPLALHQFNFSTRSKAMGHIVRTFFIGNVGIYALVESYVWMAGTAERINHAAGDLLPNIDYKIYAGVWVVVAIAGFIWFSLLPRYRSIRASVAIGDSKAKLAPRISLVMYKIHRTIHENLTLFESVHRAHHISVYPTILDAIGTQAAVEIIALTLAAIPVQFLLPDELWFVVLLLVMRGECRAHRSPAKLSDFAHHQLHHRYPRANYGIGGPYWDQEFGTRRLISKEPEPSLEVPATLNNIPR